MKFGFNENSDSIQIPIYLVDPLQNNTLIPSEYAREICTYVYIVSHDICM